MCTPCFLDVFSPHSLFSIPHGSHLLPSSPVKRLCPARLRLHKVLWEKWEQYNYLQLFTTFITLGADCTVLSPQVSRPLIIISTLWNVKWPHHEEKRCKIATDYSFWVTIIMLACFILFACSTVGTTNWCDACVFHCATCGVTKGAVAWGRLTLTGNYPRAGTVRATWNVSWTFFLNK